jgi:integrase
LSGVDINPSAFQLLDRPNLEALLRGRRHYGIGWTTTSFSPTSSDSPRGHSNIVRAFRPLLESAGLPRIRFHDLRHTAATLMLGRGVHAKLVSEMLGHASIGITLDIYSHALPSMHREAAEVMEDLLSG